MKLTIHYYPQHKNYSCGPVSLRMLFEHLGVEYTEDQMIQLCHTMPKKWTDNISLVREVQREWLVYEEREGAHISDLLIYLENGYPVLINYFNPLGWCGHYAVLVWASEERKELYLADPANGNDYTLSFHDFRKLWHSGDGRIKWWLLVIWHEKIAVPHS